MRWFRRHPIFTLLVLLLVSFGAFVTVDSGVLSGEIPKGKTGTSLLPGDLPYVMYIPNLDDNLVKSFKATASFGQRDFTKRAGASYRERVLLAPGLETSVDPYIYPVNEAIMYLCGSEITIGTLPD